MKTKLKISDIKSTLINEHDALITELGTLGKVEAGLRKVSLSFLHTRLHTTLLDIKYNNHLLVLVSSDLGKFSEVDEDKRTRFVQFFSLLHKYWKDYAECKKKLGVMFLVESNFNARLGESFSDTLCQNIPLAVKTDLVSRMKSFLNNVDIHFIGGEIDTEIKNQTSQFYKKLHNIEQLFERNPLLSLTDSYYQLTNLFSAKVYAHYHGVTYEVETIDDYEIITFTNANNPDDIYQSRNELIELEDMLKHMEVKNRLRNLTENPRIHFDKMLNKFLYTQEDKQKNKLHDYLMDILGGWEEVEKECYTLLKNNTEEIQNYIIHDITDSISKKKIQIKKASSDLYHYYFLITHQARSTYQIIVTNKDEFPEALKSKIIEFML